MGYNKKTENRETEEGERTKTPSTDFPVIFIEICNRTVAEALSPMVYLN